jgi:uncharacterized membrane protein (DUF4010 family)
MIALVAGISFAGYVAARMVGSQRGLLVTGLSADSCPLLR